MSNNYWNQQQGNNQPAQHNGNPRPGSKLHNYSERPLQAPPQYAPPAGQAPQGVPPYSPMPPVYTPQQQSWPAAQGGYSSSFFGNAMQTVRRWSGKIVAARGGNVDQSPLVLYRPPAPPLPPKSKPWKRSHTVRVAMQMRRRRERWEQAHPGGKKILSTTLIIFSLLLVVAISSGTASAYAYYQNQLPRLQGLANQQIKQTTRIYDRNGNLLYTAYDNKEGRRTPVTFNYLPGVMQDAMVATEDHTFWDNTGIDLQGILRAVTEYATSGSVGSGGSTITQQLIKNLTGDTQVSLQRKIPEAALAIGLTQQFPKWKILEMYLNVSPFGAQELGVEAAVEDYFGLKLQCDQNFKCIPAIANLDLDPKTGKRDPLLALARASLLAGMPQNPVTYDPTLGADHKKLALARQHYVLQQMLSLNMHLNTGLGDQTIDNGPITTDMIQQVEAMTAKMNFVPYQSVLHAPHFVNWVIDQLAIALGNGDHDLGLNLLLNGGFNIRTTIDANLESFVENNVRLHLRDPGYQSFGVSGPLNTLHNVNDSAVVVMNAKTGEILAMDGSADWNDKTEEVRGQVNAAVCYQHPYCRQPGSSFKPIVYATAFQMGWYPGIVLPDRKTYFPNSGPPYCSGITFLAYCPVDYGGGYHNLNSNIVLNIANSFNVPAVKALEFAGFENVLNMARRFGITDIDQDAVAKHESVENMIGASLALGAAGISLLQMVGAYQVFANQGTRIPPQGILDIWDNYGHHLYHYDPTHPTEVQVISQQIAFLMTSILSDNPARQYEFGSSSSVLTMQDWDNRPVAAKTGTSEDFRDNLTLGYTPDLVVGVWSGNADGTPMNGVVGISGAAPIWHDVIEYASGRCINGCGDLKFPRDQFVQPPGVIQQSVNTVNGLAGSGYLSWMLESDKPQQSGIITNNGNGNGTPTPTPTPTP